MPDTKISALTELTSGAENATDFVPMVDISDTSMNASGTTKKIKPDYLLRTMRSTVLPAPAGLTASTDATRGHLTTATYYYVYTVVDADGNEFAKSAETSVAVTGPNGFVTMVLNPSASSNNVSPPVPGAYKYRLYRGTSTGAQDRYITVLWNTSARDYGDTGEEVVAAPPSSGTLYDNALKRNGGGWLSGQQLVVNQDWTTQQVNVSAAISAFVASKQSGRVFDGHTAVQGVCRDRNDVTNKTITGAANNGSGLVRITATSHGYSNGDRITVYGITGTVSTAANGLWTISNVAANTFDLVGSTFSGTYTSGGTATNRGLLYPGLFIIEPKVDRAGMTSNTNGDDANCVVCVNNGSAQATEAVYIGTNGNMAKGFDTGFVCDAPCTNGMKVSKNCDVGIYLQSSTFTTGISMSSSTYTDGIDMSTATVSGAALKCPNNIVIKGTSVGIGIATPAVLNGGLGLHIQTSDGSTAPEIYVQAASGTSVASILTLLGRSSSTNVRLNAYAGGGGGVGSLGTESNHILNLFTNGSGNTRLQIAADGGVIVPFASGGKLGFFGTTPVVRPSAFTQTYSTASHTHAAVTASNPPAGGTGTAAGGYDTAANRNLMITSLTNNIADVANLKQVVNGIIDDLQSVGLFQ